MMTNTDAQPNLTASIILRDPGMPQKLLSQTAGTQAELEAWVTKVFASEAAQRSYTVAYVLLPGDSRKRGERWVRALGESVWKRWAEMSSLEQHYWRLQDAG
jgi:hypothetical protein